MPELLFRLNQVPDDEAQEVRELLQAHDIRFYETSAGLLGLSLAGIWLADSSQLAEARALVTDYSRRRSEAHRQELQDLQARGEVETFWQRMLHQPFRSLLLIIAAAAILYISVVPFLKGFN